MADEGITVGTPAVTQELYDRLNLFEQFTAAAYCLNNNDSPGNKLTCAGGACPLVEQSTTVTLTEFQEYVYLLEISIFPP